MSAESALNAQRWILPQQNNLHAQSASLNTILGAFVIWTLFILFLNTSPSEAYEVTPTRPLSQVTAGEFGKPVVQLSFQTIAKGYRSGVRESWQIVAHNQAEWDSVWKRHLSVETNPPPPPAIDFNKQIVAAVFLGEKPTGGYDVEIIRAEQSDGALVLHYREKSPLPGSLAIQALTQPFHIIQVVRDDNLRPTFRRAS
jgi:protease stability complex PrcB-like protein